jgi:large subunit ribosomal protein L9
MKVILTAGDVVTVKDGYARNYLIPQDMAMLVNKYNSKMIDALKEREAVRVMKEEEKAKFYVSQLEKHTFTFTAKSGKGDKLFGSITSAQIAEAISAKLEFEVDKKDLVLEHSIKSLGEFEVKVRFFREIFGIAKIKVEAEESEESPVKDTVEE